MGCESIKVWLVLLPIVVASICVVDGEPQVPCVFIFGDSLSESGNNNYLLTAAKANYPPYGIDFPNSRPTGRFTNGFTLPDFLTRFLGFENLIPPFLNRIGSNILRGVNYASGASGILDKTGIQTGININLEFQINNHRVIVSEMALRQGDIRQAKQYLNKCMYLINIGSNDYINNYFMPTFYPSSRLYNLTQYADLLVYRYSQKIMELQRLGARKFALFGLGLIGCTPFAKARAGSSSCVEEQNRAASIFNERLKSLVDNNNNQSSFPGSKFIYVNITAITTQIVLNSQSLGLRVTDTSCCATNAESGLCTRDMRPCENRNEYVLYDAFHPTQAMNQVVALLSYNASIQAFTSPMDISQLANLT